MTTKSPDKVTIQAETPAPAPVSTNGAAAEVSSELQAKAAQVIEQQHAFLMERTDAYRHRMNVQRARRLERAADDEPGPELGEPILASGYQYWNCFTTGPYQFFADPPYRPSRIIAFGEPALMLAWVFVNPVNSDGGGLPGTVVLGSRDYRARFETINLSLVTNGPDSLTTGTFGGPANVWTPVFWWINPPAPGADADLYEVHFTIDIVQGGQPLAAFSTWHENPDTEPPFFVFPPVGPGFQYEIPARFLVYRK